jgi:hypothetical protein
MSQNETSGSRPEWVHCITSPATGKVLCDRPTASFDWQFQGLDHAYDTVLRGGRLVPCPQCVKNVAYAMENVDV